MSEQLLTGAATPEEVSGEELSFSPLTQKDFEELNLWIRQKFITDSWKIVQSVEFDLDKNQAQRNIFRAASELTWSSAEGRQYTASREGLARIAWLMSRKTTQISWKKFQELAFQEKYESENLEKFDKLFVRVNFPSLNGDDDKESTKKGADKGRPTTPAKSTAS